MNAFQNCYETSDSIPLYLPQQLYLKPIARLNISLQLPSRMLGKNVSNWEAMEKLRTMIKPEKFISLKVTKTNLEFIRFEAELDTKIILEKVITKLDNKMIKLKDFPELMKLRAGEAKLKFPTRHVWDSFFRDTKDMNEMKPGERPDTVYLSNLPIKWFVPYHLSGEEDAKPAEKIFFRVFEKFGRIRNIDVPICDPYRNKMKSEVSGMHMYDFDEHHYFEGYVQYKDYIGFTKAMDALRGMKLLHKSESDSHAVNMNVDFDRSKHLSDASIRRREIVRDRLVKKEIEKEEKEKHQEDAENCRIQAERQLEIDEKLAKEQRRYEREERRKTKLLAKLKVKSSEDINEKIVKEEKKLLKAQRKLEAIRLIEELFKRINIKKEKNKLESKKNNEGSELNRLKTSSEMEVRQQKEKLNQVIQGRTVLKGLLTDSSHIKNHDDSSSSDSSSKKKEKKENYQNNRGMTSQVNQQIANVIPTGDWYNGYPPPNGMFPYQVPPVYSHPMNYQFNYQSHHNRGRGRGVYPGSSRGNYYPRGGRGRRYRGQGSTVYPPELHAQYYRYFEKFLDKYDEHDHRRSRSGSRCSRSRSRRRSSSRSRQRSLSRSRRRSRSRSKSSSRHSRSKSCSRSRTRRSRRSSRSKSRSRSSYTRSKRKSSHSRRRSTSAKRSTSRHSSRSRSHSRKSKEKRKSRSPSYRSIDSSKFISPSRLRMPRSKSWSLPN